MLKERIETPHWVIARGNKGGWNRTKVDGSTPAQALNFRSLIEAWASTYPTHMTPGNLLSALRKGHFTMDECYQDANYGTLKALRKMFRHALSDLASRTLKPTDRIRLRIKQIRGIRETVSPTLIALIACIDENLFHLEDLMDIPPAHWRTMQR
jgi:hypothetical protein